MDAASGRYLAAPHGAENAQGSAVAGLLGLDS